MYGSLTISTWAFINPDNHDAILLSSLSRSSSKLLSLVDFTSSDFLNFTLYLLHNACAVELRANGAIPFLPVM
jgi:hypothetical protein